MEQTKVANDAASVIAEVTNGAGWIKLNRPRAINSLQADMVETVLAQLEAWQSDERVALVCIEGEGDKGLCAGGDMRALYERKDRDAEAYAERFFSAEYRMDELIHRYPKPVVVFMHGIVMGGGVGLSIGASHRIVTETTRWAMPEMHIGFFPDVGASYFLNRFHGSLGRYLALTSRTIAPEDVLYIGAGDHYVTNENGERLKRAIRENKWAASLAGQQLNELIRQHAEQPEAASTLAALRAKVDEHFGRDTVEEIMASLAKDAETDEWADQTMKELASKSPISLKVTLSQLQRGLGATLQQCLQMEIDLAMNFMTCDDFYEGVRAVLVDKDRNPRWKSTAPGSVTQDRVASFFSYAWPHGRHPLREAFGA